MEVLNDLPEALSLLESLEYLGRDVAFRMRSRAAGRLRGFWVTGDLRRIEDPNASYQLRMQGPPGRVDAGGCGSA